MTQNAAFDDANIPVLTEVVQDKAVVPASAGLEPAPAAAAAAEQDWSELERRIAERALEQLQDPVSRMLDQALAGLADQLRGGLRPAIEAAVAHAVAEEVARLKSET
jgi:type VI protein secretion system component VasK